MYKEKPTKGSRKSVTISDSTSLVPRKAYVEDAPDADLGDQIVSVESAPPEAPTPPPANNRDSVNVFDFLVTEETPNASRINLGGDTQEPMQIEERKPSTHRREGEKLSKHDREYKENGFSYGHSPIPSKETSYQTPASKKHQHKQSLESTYEPDSQDRKSTDKKRKRQNIEDLDLSKASRSSQELDELMPDAPPVLHSGLTGGLNRLLSKNTKFPPTPDYSNGEQYDEHRHDNFLTPIIQTRVPRDIKAREKDRDREREMERERGRHTSASTALVKIRRKSVSASGNGHRRTSDESRPRKKHHHSHRQGADSTERSQTRPKKRKHILKAIEYPETQQSNNPIDSQQQLILFRTRAELFLSFINKGPESEKGVSLNKALKRYHRERGDQGLGLGKVEEEKELWKLLRLRRNERGEIVLIV